VGHFCCHGWCVCHAFNKRLWQITNSVDLSPSWDATTPGFPKILWNPKTHAVFTRAIHWFLSWAIPPHLISLRPILILSTHLLIGLPSGLFPSGFRTKILCTILFYIASVLYVLPISSSLTLWSFLLYLANSTSNEVSRYAIFYNPLPLRHSSDQIFSWAPCSQIPSVSLLALIS
jgi:hypothetical protein